MNLSACLTPLALLGLVASCAVTSDGDICDLAASHVLECTGETVPDFEPGTCSESVAEDVAAMTCSELGGDAKADSTRRPFWLVLEADADREDAESKAQELRDRGIHNVSVQPHTQSNGKSGYLVVFGTCPKSTLNAILITASLKELRSDIDIRLVESNEGVTCGSSSEEIPMHVVLYDGDTDEDEAYEELARIQALDPLLADAYIDVDVIGNHKIIHGPCPMPESEAVSFGREVQELYGLLGDGLVSQPQAWSHWEQQGCAVP